MPAAPTNLVYLTWLFSLSRAGTDEDIALFSIATSRPPTEPDQTGLDSITAGAYKAWKDNAPTAYWGENVFLSGTIGTQYKTDGHTLREAKYVPDSDPDHAWKGSSSGAVMPWETSLAVSLYCYPRGSFQTDARRHRGRFYLPPMSASVLDPSTSGFFRNNLIGEAAIAMANFVQDVGQDGLGVKILDAGVWSRKDNVVRPAIQVSMDAKFDSQRRRQNRENSGHIEVPV